MNISTKRPVSPRAKLENSRLTRRSKYCHSPMLARVAAIQPKLSAIYSNLDGSELINFSRRKLPTWKALRAPQKCVITNAAMLELQRSGFDALTLTFNLSNYYQNMIMEDTKKGVSVIPESIPNCIKSCLKHTIFEKEKEQPIYLWFALEDCLAQKKNKSIWKPHGHGGILVPSDWRANDRAAAIDELEAAIKKAICHDYKGKGVHISTGYERRGDYKPINIGWGLYAAKDRPKKMYASKHVTPIVRKYYEALRKPTQ